MSTTIQNAMAAAGLQPHKDLDLPDNGGLIRYRVTGDKAGSCNGWAVLHGGACSFGAFGSWKTGESHTWQAERFRPMTAQASALERQLRDDMRQRYAVEREAVQAAARAKAARLWGRARPASNAHPYLERKRVNAYGLRQLGSMLLVPARDHNGMLHTLQFILPDGGKRFLSGGQVNACYFSIGRPVDTLLLCEGMATAATLYEATGHATAACFSCGNLAAVAQALRAKFPSLKLIVCADNDAQTPGNPGLTKAREAARAVRGYLAVPRFSVVPA